MKRNRGFNVTTLISLGLLSFLTGLVLARRIYIVPSLEVWLVILLFSPLLFFRKLSMLIIVLFGLLFGILRGSVYKEKIDLYSSLNKVPVVLIATATSDSVYADKGQLSFDVGNIQLLSPKHSELVGTIGIKGYGEPMIYRGDKVKLSGKLYLTKGSKQANISFSEIEKINKDSSVINRFRRNFSSGIINAMPEPLGSFSLGILIGQRTTLPKEFSDQISIVGLTHIIAVSGYNLTILVNLAHRLARKRSKYQSTILIILLILVFILITGFSPSIVRAAIVSGLSLWAWYYGRKFKPILLILLSAVLTAGYFPPYIWSDIGWYLSFLAFAGVLIVAPAITNRFFKTSPKPITAMFIETLSAQIMTLPIILYIFGKLSLVALIANIFVVPLIPISMLLTFIAGIGGMVFPSVVGWIAWPAVLIMSFISGIIQLFSEFPKASIDLYISVIQLIIIYSIISLIILVMWKKSTKNVKLTDRNRLV